MDSFTDYLSSISSLVIAGLLFVLSTSLIISKAKINENLKTILYIGIIKTLLLALIFIDIGLTDWVFKNGEGLFLYPLYAVIELVFIIKFLQFITSKDQHGKA